MQLCRPVPAWRGDTGSLLLAEHLWVCWGGFSKRSKVPGTGRASTGEHPTGAACPGAAEPQLQTPLDLAVEHPKDAAFTIPGETGAALLGTGSLMVLGGRSLVPGFTLQSSPNPTWGVGESWWVGSAGALRGTPCSSPVALCITPVHVCLPWVKLRRAHGAPRICP